MKIPNDTNTRAEHMWRIISKEIDFRNKHVIDLGCGTGDFLWRPVIAGAEYVRGYDIDPKKSNVAYEEIVQTSEVVVAVGHMNINRWVKNNINLQKPKKFDIAFCFSVLPYLDDIPDTLQWMAINFPTCLIEAQYLPEPYNVSVSKDEEMQDLLLNNGFISASPIGKTHVDDRNVDRTIWKCFSSASEMTYHEL